MSPVKQKGSSYPRISENAKSVEIRIGIVANLASHVTAFNKSQSKINTCPKAFLKWI